MARRAVAAPPDPAASVTSLVADGQTREVLRRLELDVTRRLDGLLHGDHRGLVPGHGTDLGDIRRYAAGDDVRRIDWNVSARLREPFLRQTIADHELDAWLLIDRSPTLDFGTARCEKRDLVLAAAAAVGFLTTRSGNRIGAVLAGKGPDTVIPARSPRNHLLRILHETASTPRSDGAGPTDLAAAMRRLGALARRRGLVVVISDFQGRPGWETTLRLLAERHETLVVQPVDPRELELPDVGLLVLRDVVTGAVHEVPTSKASVRRRFAEAAQARQERLASTFTAARVQQLVLRTDHDWLDDVVRFVLLRRARARQLSGVGR
jgi:uncharacterized protein (DUF58 family)